MALFSCAILVWVHIKDIKLSVHLPLGVNQFEPSRCTDPNGFPKKEDFTLLRNTHGFLMVLVPHLHQKRQKIKHKKQHAKPPKSQQKNQQPSKNQKPLLVTAMFFFVSPKQAAAETTEHLHSSPCVCPHIQADHLHRSSDGWSVVRNLLETNGKIRLMVQNSG